MSQSPSFLFAGGGTGGHLFPGIAVADELKKQFPGAGIEFVGSKRSVEKEILESVGYSHLGLKSKSSSELYRHPVKFLTGNWQAYRECYSRIQKNRPNVVIGLGGFSSVPVITAAYRSRVPVVLLEQNTIPGRANRLLNSMSSAICTSFDQTETYLSRKARIEQTGNPVREKIQKMKNEDWFNQKSDSRTLLILGGSQGATAVNKMMMDSISSMKQEIKTWRIIHQTGKRDFEKVKNFYTTQKLNATVSPFFDDIGICYENADLVISRAGATTLAELSVLGLPSILIPFPESLGNHQLYNACHYADQGAAKIVEQESDPYVSVSTMIGQLRPLLKMDNLRYKLRLNMLKLARDHATEDVVKVILEIADLTPAVHQHPHHVHFLKKRSEKPEMKSFQPE